MQIPKIGWLELDDTISPLRFYPTQSQATDQKTRTLSVTLGKEFPAQIKIQPNKIEQKTPFHLPLRTRKTADGNYQLGPFIAILTSDRGTPFAGNHQNFIDLIQMGKRMGVTVFVLTLLL